MNTFIIQISNQYACPNNQCQQNKQQQFPSFLTQQAQSEPEMTLTFIICNQSFLIILTFNILIPFICWIPLNFVVIIFHYIRKSCMIIKTISPELNFSSELTLECNSLERVNSETVMTYTANDYRQTTDKLIFKSVISTQR